MVARESEMLAYLDERLGEHQGRGPEFQFACPACIDRTGADSDGYKLGINIVKQLGGCFRCGFGFRSMSQLFRYLNGGHLTIKEIALLREEVQLPSGTVASALKLMFKKVKAQDAPLRPRKLPLETIPLAKLKKHQRMGSRTRLAFEYLFDVRGATEDMIDEFSIGYCAHGRYAKRLVFPVFQGGKQVYFTTRYCGDSDVKSLNASNEEGHFQRKTCLLGYDNCVGQEAIALVEGPFDMMAFEHAVAGMGKHVSEEQINLVAGLVPKGLQEVVIAADAGAGKSTDATYAKLLPVVPVVSVLNLTHGDPWSRRAELASLLESRGEPSVGARIRQRFGT